MSDQDKPKLDYATPQPSLRSHWIHRGIIVAIAPFALWGLFELQRMPYRPPWDMSTFLGGPEIVAVRAIMAVIGVLWITSPFHFVVLMRRR